MHSLKIKTREIIINKFGGEIMDDPRLVELSVGQIKNQLKKGDKPIVVVSALKGVTDELVLVITRLHEKRKANGIVKLFIADITKKHLAWIHDCLKGDAKISVVMQAAIAQLEQDLKVVASFGEIAEVSDKLLSYGERLSSLLFTELLIQHGIPCRRFTGEEIGIMTDRNFGDANIDYLASARNIRARLNKQVKFVPVLTGFIGKTRSNQTTTLGRGGSDTTACLLGAALSAQKVILWKNVPGVLTADPKIVSGARTVKALNYDQAEESGKVIHDKSMALIRQAGTAVEVTYIKDPNLKTVISSQGGNVSGALIISSKDNLRLLTIIGEKIKHYGALAEITAVITRNKINMALIRNTRDTLYIVIEKNGHGTLKCEAEIKSLNYQLKAQDVSMVNVIGDLSWTLVERFNHLLAKTCQGVVLGAFPYQECVRLEAIVAPEQVNELVRKFHREFIG